MKTFSKDHFKNTAAELFGVIGIGGMLAYAIYIGEPISCTIFGLAFAGVVGAFFQGTKLK